MGAIPQAAIADEAVASILVTPAPLQPVVDALLAGVGHSQTLTRPGQDAHALMLSPSQARALDNAHVIVVPNRSMNSGFEKLVARKGRHGAAIIALSELRGAQPLDYTRHQPWLEGDDHTHEAPEPTDDASPRRQDPHLWMDPLRMAAIATPLAEALGEHMPSHAATLRANAQRLADHLRNDVQPNIAAMLADRSETPPYQTRPFIPFITGHAAYQYFFDRYGITDSGALIIQPEEYLGARSMHDMRARAEKIAVGCLITEQVTPTVQKFSAATGATIVRLSPETLPAREDVPALPWVMNDYDRLLYVTAKTFADCL